MSKVTKIEINLVDKKKAGSAVIYVDNKPVEILKPELVNGKYDYEAFRKEIFVKAKEYGVKNAEEANSLRKVNYPLNNMIGNKFAGKCKIDTEAVKRVVAATAVKLTLATTGITVVGTTLNACGILNNDDATVATTDESAVENVVEEAVTTEDEIVAPEFFDSWDEYVENAPEITQKAFFMQVENELENFEKDADWTVINVTPEMVADIEAEDGIFLTGKDENGATKAVFALTPEQMMAAHIMNDNYSYEALASIMHGEKIDVTKVYNSAESDYNQFLRIAQETYWNTDKTHIYNEDFGLDFGEAGNAAVEHYEDLLAEIKQLHREGKEKELTEALKKFKKEIVAYGYAQNEGQDLAKAWTLKTVLPAANVFAQMHEVKDTYVVNLYDTQSNSTISKEVLTDVFAEPVMRDLILGYNSCVGDDGHVYVSAFDQVEWLNKNGLDGKRYKLNISDDINTNGSKADQLYNDGVTMLNEYNDRITDAKLENTVADSATTADSVKPIDDNSEYDTLTKGGYNVNDIISLMNVKLIELGKTPMNINVFTTKYAKFIQEYMNTIGMSIGADGKLVDKSEGVKRVVKTVAPQMKVTAVTHTYTESWTERETKKESVSENDSENVKAKEDAISNAKKTKVKDKDGKDKDTTYEDVYNNEFNKNGAVDKQKTGLDPTDSVKDDDELGKKVEKWAKEDAEANKKAHEEAGKDAKEVYKDKEGTHYISGGDEHKEEEYNNADTAAEEEARKYNEELQRRREAESQIQSQPEVQTQEETSTGGYSGSEVIDEDGFAPVVDEETVEEVNGPSLGR